MSSGNAGSAGPSGEAEPGEAVLSGNAGPSGEGHGENEGSEGGREATRGHMRKGKG